MLSLPHLPSPPYFFNKVLEVIVKAGGSRSDWAITQLQPSTAARLGSAQGSHCN